MSVERFDCSDSYKHGEGDYVLYSDYEKLEKECNKRGRQLDDLMGIIKTLSTGWYDVVPFPTNNAKDQESK